VHRDLSAIFKAYDVRGTYPDEIDEDAARRVGAALARFTEAPKLAVGRDMRISSEELARAFAEGASGAGAAVVDLGLVSTDGLYFASGKLDVPACMVTASHNPARYNGFKPCRAGAAPSARNRG
jgi:phosphomannomutase